jgi:hypothetical protein
MPEPKSTERKQTLKSQMLQHKSVSGLSKQELWLRDKEAEAREEIDNEIQIEEETANFENPECKPENIRLYQIKRDLVLDPNSPDIIGNYMELVVQFGFITLFSVVFPLAPILSLFANIIQMDTQKQNMIYSRRFKAEVANGIGPWLEILVIITKIAVIVNMASIFFTSSIATAMFTGVDYEGLFKRLKDHIEPQGDFMELDNPTLPDDLRIPKLLAHEIM